jgi:zinc transporter
VTNNHLHLLSIVTTLFLPPTLVTGLFGMNTKGPPFTENEHGFLLGRALPESASIDGIGLFRLLVA